MAATDIVQVAIAAKRIAAPSYNPPGDTRPCFTWPAQVECAPINA